MDSAAIPVSLATLADLSPRVATPTYDPTRVRAGIVHLGLGGFARAHLARYTHDLMTRDPAHLEWGVLGAGLHPGGATLLRTLGGQDGLYTLVERDPAAETVQVIGALAGVIDASATSAGLLQALEAPEVRLVTLTVTEQGYGLDPASKTLDPDHPVIASDLRDPRRPRSPVGVIVEAYRRRRLLGGPTFSVLSCDNIQHSGRVLEQAVLDFADRIEPGLADWISARGAFPNAMVDRITPATKADDIAALATRHGVRDAAPVFCEPFRQWVIEDRFVAGRPPWDAVGAQFVDDVTPYEFMKLRLLNASHLAIAAAGQVMGHIHVHEALADPVLRRFVATLMDRETGPTVPPTPGIDLGDYAATVLERFANPDIPDTVQRINDDAPLNYLLDPLRDRLARGQSIDLLALAVAAWIRRMRGDDEAGRRLIVRHPLADAIRERATAGGEDPTPVLRMTPLFGDLGGHPVFALQVGAAYAALCRRGVAQTLKEAVDAG